MSGEDQFADVGRGIRICYRVDGDPKAPPVLLLAGLGLDLTSWADTFVTGLVASGLQVIRADNRDAGRSTRATSPVPTRWQQARGAAPEGAYTVEDMAADHVALLDALHLGRVHLVGMSLGGMIAQTIAAAHPDRVLSLTSIFSTTGNRAVGQPARSTVMRLMSGPVRSETEFADRHLAMMGHIGSTHYTFDPEAERQWAIQAWARGAGNQRGASMARQIGAINASGDRTAALGAITAPTLVIHGDRDLMVAATGGQATAAAIPRARHMTIPGLRHQLPDSLTPDLLGPLLDHLATTARPPSNLTKTDPNP